MAQSTLFTVVLKVGALCVASALVLRRFTVVGTDVFVVGAGSVLRGAYWPSNEHKDDRPVALKTV